jgi:hypothetical protein
MPPVGGAARDGGVQPVSVTDPASPLADANFQSIAVKAALYQ